MHFKYVVFFPRMQSIMSLGDALGGFLPLLTAYASFVVLHTKYLRVFYHFTMARYEPWSCDLIGVFSSSLK